MTCIASGALLVLITLTALCRTGRSQAAVEGKTGFSVLLPCVYTDSDLPPKPTVIWKDPREDTLLILNQTKIPKRVKTFPQLHSKGNFSILLQDLRASDSGDYECNIFHLDKQFVKLSIMTGKSMEDGTHGGATVNRPWDCYIVILASFVSCLHLKR
ncbi:hypothetical protein NQD34_001267 [Periophthalmus magnuspinnatus]|nr:hypothetical protein NQD34_001267 [Periophthalmus magnuspinnatus]